MLRVHENGYWKTKAVYKEGLHEAFHKMLGTKSLAEARPMHIIFWWDYTLFETYLHLEKPV